MFLAVVSQASDIGTNKRANQDKMVGTIDAQVIKISVSINDPTKVFLFIATLPNNQSEKKRIPDDLIIL